jgi:rRNA maturation endonuclease Nob1
MMRPTGISRNAQWWWGCKNCSHEWEDDSPESTCPKCGGKGIATYPVALRFKGHYAEDGTPILE